jgi:Bacterial conjugation TrbI-like protein
VIPAGTEVHGTAQTDRHRERIASGNNWTFVWQSGEELRLKGIALDREFSGDQEGWGITDGSAGLRGRLLKSDNLAEIKLFAATFLSGAASSLTEKEQTIFGSIDSRSLNNAPFKGAEKVLSVYAQRIYDAIQRDGFYVRVPSGKQFYIYILQTIDRSDAVIGGTLKPFAEEGSTNAPAFVSPVSFGVATTPAGISSQPNSTPTYQP